MAEIKTTDKDITTDVTALIQRRMRHNDAVRTAALESFRQLGLPTARSEEYKHTPIRRALEQNFTFEQTATEPVITDIADHTIPGLEKANVLVFINGVYASEHSRVVSPASELRIENLQEALDKGDEAALAHYNQHVQGSQDPFVAWNTADWQSGVFIRVPDKAVVQLPVVFYHIQDTSAGEVTASLRNLVVTGKNSRVTIVEKFASAGSANHFTNLVNEIAVDENAQLDYYHLQTDRGNRFQFTQTEIHQKQFSRVNAFTYDLQGRVLRTNLHLIIDGEGIESHMYGLYLVNGDTLSDNHTVVDHRQPHSMTNELYKGVMDDTSRGVFNGKIYVRPQAQKTNAFQANRNMLLSESASVHTKPQLEIWADDVKCSHGCTTGQLDEEALFYLRSRGIDRKSARAMMLYAFAAETFDKIPDTVLRGYVEAVVNERLQNNP